MMNISFDEFSYKRKPPLLIISDSTEEDSDDDRSVECLETLCSEDEIMPIKRKRRSIVVESDSEDEERRTQVKRNRFICDDSDEDEVTIVKEVQSPTKSLEHGISSSQEKVYDFISTCTLNELVVVPGCSLKRAEKIKSLMPFNNYDHMANKLSILTAFPVRTFLDECNILLNERDKFKSLIQHCEELSMKTKDKIQSLGTNTNELPVQQPKHMNKSMSLKPYQVFGLNWLVMLHNSKLNGILADQMGLGKTIQTLAFLGYLMGTRHKRNHLIVCPCSTLDNWVREFQKWLPDLSFIQYNGSQEERSVVRQEIKDSSQPLVIISTFNIVLSTAMDRVFFKNLDIHYLILDEAHMIKNMNSERFKRLVQFQADHRLLLTGTPLQNNIKELMSLLIFLMPNMFQHLLNTNQKDKLEFMFGLSQSNKSNEKITDVKKMLHPFVLRRLKEDVLLDMPKKIDKSILCELTTYQKQLYKSSLKTLSKSVCDDKYSLGMLMELRKITNHGLLVRSKYKDDVLEKMASDYVMSPFHFECNKAIVMEDMGVMSDFELHMLCTKDPCLKQYRLCESDICDGGKLRVLDDLLPELQKNGDRVLLFSQFVVVLDILEAYLCIRKIKYTRLDGSVKGSQRQSLIDEYNNTEDILIFLLSTKAGGLGINLTSANIVILHDIDFNPYNDKQAEDRCHRMGQTRQVTVYKLIGEDTVEENMLKCGERKLMLEKKLVGNIDVSESDVTRMARDIIHENVFKRQTGK